MGLAKSGLLLPVNEYLTLERESEERHEYLDGQVYAMAGESPEHGTICTNLTMLIASQLRGTSCQAWSKDMKVRSGPAPGLPQTAKGQYSYPDLVVVCGVPLFHDEYRDVLLNPKLIIEVLSPATEAYDRGQKFLRYRTWLESLTDYLVVAQSEPLVEHFTRQGNGPWVIAAAVNDISGCVEIAGIGCTLQLSEVYYRIIFPVPPVEEALG